MARCIIDEDTLDQVTGGINPSGTLVKHIKPKPPQPSDVTGSNATAGTSVNLSIDAAMTVSE